MKNMKVIITSFILILVSLFSPLISIADSEDLFDNIDYKRGNQIRVILEGQNHIRSMKTDM